jgi:hypothetical protein
MKRLLNYLPFLFLLAYFPARAIDIYVSPQGSDNNTGTKEKPLASLQAALFKVRELRRVNDPVIADGIHIILSGGVYSVHETIVIRPEDAGTVSSPTIIDAAKDEKPVLSGGVPITNWKKVVTAVSDLSAKAKGNIWVADVPDMQGNIFSFRQLWVNGQKAVRAKSVNGDKMNRIISWNKKEQSCWIPTPKFPSISSVKGAEMFIHQWWAIAVLRIKKMEIHGDSTQLFFHQPESKIQSEHPWPAPWISKETGNSPFYLTNAIQFLDEPGEWFLDLKHKKIYYWPRENENLLTASVIAPFTETLIKAEGTIDKPVANIYFKGVSFQYTGWLRPSLQGHVPHQDGLYMTEAYKLKPAGTKEKPALDNQAWIGRPAAAVEISFANNIKFNNCCFEHLGSTGLDMHLGVHNSLVNGNLFKDISGNGMLIGEYSDAVTEIHLAYHPKDERVVCDSITVSNNLITDATNEDWSCVGISAGYVRNTTIAHNEVENVAYSGISLGWGWNPLPNVMKNNKIFANKIHFYGKHNYDCSGIYTLSAQPGTVISENYVDSIYKAPYAHLPSHWFYLYTDEGSSYMTVKENWTPSTKYLQNANGPGNVWENNGPQVNDAIKENAGLEKSYQYLLKEKTSASVHLPINEEHPELIELITKEGESLDIKGLKQFLSESKMDSNAVYQWHNHYVIFDKVQDVTVFLGKLQDHFPDAEVKVYYDLLYNFNRQKHCPGKTVAKEWDHIILTANLVADKKMQQEYIDYHTTQFEKWPEVAAGFCNADFQELLVFKNGRHLMLVISIPKGKTLEELNPKTVENNPKMMEWNKIMSKYQEGIEGTKKGEVWVFLNHIVD